MSDGSTVNDIATLTSEIDGVVTTCKEVKFYACEMASELTFEVGGIVDTVEEASSVLKKTFSDNPDVKEQWIKIESVLENLKFTVMKAAALGGMVGMLQDVYEPLEEIAGQLKRVSNLDMFEVETVNSAKFSYMWYRQTNDLEWEQISREDIVGLPLLERASLLLGNELQFLTKGGKLLPKSECLLELARIGSISHRKEVTSTDFRVLVVDDDTLVQSILKKRLSLLLPNADIVQAYSVQEAKDSVNRLPDVVFLDVKLPDGSGLDFLKYARGELSLAALPVFVMTANPTEEIRSQARELIVSGFLDKSEADHALKLLLDFARMYERLRSHSGNFEKK